MHRSQNKNKIILILLMMFGMFLGSCKGPLNLKDDLLNAQKVYITISTNLSDSEARTVMPTGFNSESTGFSWNLTGTKEDSNKTISYKWEDEKDFSGQVIKSAYSKMTSSDTVIELEEGKWTFELTVNNTEGKKVLQSNLTQTISSDTDNLNFVMKEPTGEGVAQGQIEFTLTFPAGTVGKVEATLTEYGKPNEQVNPQPLDLQTGETEDSVTYTNTVSAGTYMLKLDLKQQDPAVDTYEDYKIINTYTCLIRVAPGLKSVGSYNLSTLAKLYQISYKYIDDNQVKDAQFDKTVTTSYNKYQTFILPEPKRSGYTFKGWYEAADCSGNKVTSYKIPDDFNGTEIVFYADWEKVYITNFSKEGVLLSEGIDLEIINSSENTSYGKIVNEIYSQNNIWDKYLRLSDGKFFKGANYSVSLALKADKPSVVAISAARADLYFTVTEKWQEYTFETGFIETDLVDNVNAISMGIAKTSGLCIANVTVNEITDADGKVVDNGLPTLSFNLGNAAIEYYIEKLPKDDQGLLKPIICVETKNINKGYQITINTKENDNNPDSDSITVNLRDYVTPGLNMASFILESPYSSSIEGYPITNLDGSGTPTKDESKSLKSSIINTWSNSSVKGKEETQYVAVPVPSDTNVNDPVPYSISGLLKNVKNESSTVTIKNFNIEKISNLENTDKTFAIRVGQNWSKLSDLSEPIQLTSSSDTELQVVLTDKDWESWDNAWKANEYYCQFKVYKAKDSNLRVTAVNGELCKVSGAEKIKLSLTDDFTVLIEEVTGTNNDQPSGGGTGGESESNGSSDLKYYAKEGDTAEYLEILTSAGLEKYRDIINGTLTNDIKFSTVRTFNANGSPYAISAKLACDVQVSNWIPIGIPETTVFSFDGQKHSINITSMHEDACDYAGVFGSIGQEDQKTIIENLIVKGNISSSTAKYSGGIVAYSRGVTIKNCVNYATITNGNTTEGVAGGIIGHAYGSSTINGSVNFATIQASKSAGGIVGKSFGYDKWSSSTLLINKCVNIGDIKGSTTNAFVSGVVGHANFTTKIIDCINFGAMTFAEGGLSLNTSGFAWITLYGSEQNCSITNCISVGVPTSYDDMYYAITNYNDSSKSTFAKLYYDSKKWEGKIARDDSVVGVIAKTTTDLCKLTTTVLSDNWSFAEEGDNTRYPLPNLEEDFGNSSEEESIWEQICDAAQIQDSASAAVMASDL